MQETGTCRATFALEGMTCASCAMRIEKGLKKVPGVQEASVNLATEQAMVTYDPTQTDVETMVQKVDAIGYQATPLTVPAATPAQAQEQSETYAIFEVEEMTCASCAMSLEKGLKKVPGVKEARVNLASEQATVIYDPAQTGVEQLVQKVDAVGYKAIPQTGSLEEAIKRTHAASSAVPSVDMPQASPADAQRQRRQAELARKRALLILGIVLTVPVVILNNFFMNSFPSENFLLLALTTPVWAVVGWEFHRVAIKRLRHAGANMDTLISVGSTAAYLISVVATFFPRVVGAATFYDTAAAIVTLIFLGKYLETREKGQTNEAISKLLGLQTIKAHVIREDVEVEMPI